LALASGRRCEEFNEMFVKLCTIILTSIDDFMKKREGIENLNKEKLVKTVVSKIQDYLFQRYSYLYAGQSQRQEHQRNRR
jgi:hypothetical protein